MVGEEAGDREDQRQCERTAMWSDATFMPKDMIHSTVA